MPQARYDAVADFYTAGWPDAYDDPASAALLELVGPVTGLAVLDVACGHGRLTRELCRRGGRVIGVDLSAALVARARAAEREAPLGARYVVADASARGAFPPAPPPEAAARGPGPTRYAVAVCAFGLSDIDDLDGVLRNVAAAVGPGGRFVFCILHPCFPGAGEVSGSWPGGGGYLDERWWVADGALSTLRARVGAHHRTLSTYLNALRRHELWLDAVAEPAPPAQWAASRPEAARYPVFLVVRCRRG